MLPLSPRRAHERGVGEQQTPIAVRHGKTQRQLTHQRFEMRRCRAAAAAGAKPLPGIHHQHQRRRGIGIGIARKVGIGNRHMIEHQRPAASAIARPADPLAIVLAQHRDEILPGHIDQRITRRALRKTGAGGADRAIGIDQRGGNARARQPLAELAIDLANQIADQIDRADGLDTPDQKVLAAPRTAHFDAPVGLGRAGDRAAHLRSGLPVAPDGADQFGNRLLGAVADRQARGIVADTEPCFIAGIGASEASGPIGKRNGHIVAVDGGDRHRPVRQREFDGGFSNAAPRQRPAEPREDQQDTGQHRRQQTISAHGPDQQDTDDQCQTDHADIGQRTARRIGNGTGALPACRHTMRSGSAAPAWVSGPTSGASGAWRNSGRWRRARCLWPIQ